MRKFAVLASITLGGTGATALAEPQAVSGDALRQLAAGKTVHLESPYGTLPVTFKDDGTLAAKASAGLALYLGSATDRGRWTVQGDRICQKFFKWFHGETHCMRIKQDGRKITWQREDGLAGTAVIAANDATPPERPVGLGVKPADLAATIRPRDEAKPETELKAAPAVVTAASAPVAPKIEAAPQTPEARIAPAIVPPRPVLASLHGLPRGLLDRPLTTGRAERIEKEAQEPAPEALAPASTVKTTPRDVVAEVLQQRAAHLWCERGADAGTSFGAQPGHTRPFIFEAVPDLTDTADHRALGAGCLMPSVALSEISRAGVFGR